MKFKVSMLDPDGKPFKCKICGEIAVNIEFKYMHLVSDGREYPNGKRYSPGKVIDLICTGIDALCAKCGNPEFRVHFGLSEKLDA